MAKVGRPLRYETEEELSQKIEEYFSMCDDRIIQVYDKKREEVVDMKKPIPYSLEGIASYLEIDRKTLLNYSKKEEFFPTIKKAREKVLSNMVERAMDGSNNPTISIFLLKNNYEYYDKQQIEHSGDENSPPVWTVNIKKANDD